MKISFAGIAVLFICLLIFSCLESRAINPETFKSSSIKVLENKRIPVLPDSFITILGRWKINHVVAGDLSAGLDDKIIKSLEGKVILFTWRMSVVFSDTCITPIYDSWVFNRTDFLFKTYGQRDDLGISADTIKVVRLRCSGRTVYKGIVANNYYYRFIVLNEQTLIMPYNGSFIFLDKVAEKKAITVAVKKSAVVAITKASEYKTNPEAKTGIYINQNDPADPFHILAALLNSATKLTEATQK